MQEWNFVTRLYDPPYSLQPFQTALKGAYRIQYFLGRLSRPDVAIGNSRLYLLNKPSLE